MTNLLALPSETELAGKYRIRRVLGAGGFGITYLAHDRTLGRQVTIKEYFPADYAARIDDVEAVPRSRDCAPDYKWGLDRFIAEAQTLARFEHPNIVRVFDYFQENKTAYMVLQFEVGTSLRTWHKDLKRAPRQAELDKLIGPLLDALETIHKRDFLHRDIAPDNIIVREGLSPVLIDFGSARGEIVNQSRTVSALVKPGYSPYEQYSTTTSRQGPWTDIYALGATLYQLVCGKRPPDAPSRIVMDEYVSARDAAVGSYRTAFLGAIDKALALEPRERPQSIAEWRGPLLAPPDKPAGRLGGGLTFGLRKRPAPEPEPEVVAAVGGAIAPAPPDAPQPQGQFLDYVDSLKSPGSAHGSPAGGRGAAGVLALPPPASSGQSSAVVRHGLGYGPTPPTRMADPPSVDTAPRAVGTAGLPSRIEPVPVPFKRKPLSLGYRLTFFLRPPWRGVLLKLGVGAGIATAVLNYQDLLPAAWQPVPPAPVSPARAPVVPAPVYPAPSPPPLVSRPAPEIRTLATLATHRGPVLALGFQQSGRRVVTIGSDQTVRLSDLDAPASSRAVVLGAAAATSPLANPGASPAPATTPPMAPTVAASLLGSQAVTAHADGSVMVWDIDTGARIATTRRLDGAVTALSPTDDPDRIAVAGPDGRVMVLDRRVGNTVIADDSHGDIVRVVTFVPSRNGLLTASADRTIKSWRADSLNLRRTHVGHRDPIGALAVVPDGRAFASGDEAGMIRFWSAFASQSRRTVPAHSARVSALAFAPDGGMLASAAGDGTLKIWDGRRGRELAGVQTGVSAIRALAFTSDGRRLVTAAEDGSVRLWDVSAVRGAREER